ncbi:MAG: hypothetical protein JWQ94_3742 [Tardiphaga sp.]|nr:hypothetical protein [Tardiphaga sp.]
MDDFQNRQQAMDQTGHACEQCGAPIKAGEIHADVAGMYAGDAYDYRIHLECEAAARAYAKLHGLYGEEWPWFQHQDDEPEDWRWMLKEHPVVAKRLGWDERLKEWETDDSDEDPTPALLPQDHSTNGET